MIANGISFQELIRSPEKRELLCEVVYCFVQEDHLPWRQWGQRKTLQELDESLQDTLNHILALRALKEKAEVKMCNVQ